MKARASTIAISSLGSGVFAVLVYLVVETALRERAPEPARCGEALVPSGPRCCAPGQRGLGSRCEGRASACPPPLVQTKGTCAAPPWRVAYPAGTLGPAAADWQSNVPTRATRVGRFALDAFEVTVSRWRRCVQAGECRSLPIEEPGLPVTDVTLEEARRFCRFAGGRLPKSAEWLYAAVGAGGRKFPWGPSGLVCRRAAYGLEGGPCAEGARSPEWAGARPDGVSPEGAYDLAGNVAEWSVEPDGSFVARGGSYRSKAARDLKSTSVENGGGRSDVGFRCAYDVGD